MAKAGLHLTKQCKVCGKNYKQARSDQLYCSAKCNSSAWRDRKYNYTYLKCNFCQNKFKRIHSHQKYCSKKCMQKSRLARIANGKGKGWSKGTHISIESIIKSAITKAKNGTLYNMNRANASWKSGWREIGGIKKYFRSRWEANYARYLEWLKSIGDILEWEHEPKTFWFEGIKRGCCSYLPDFRVKEKSGREEYHEVKGWMDDRSKTKIKRMSIYYPNIKLIIIEKKQYNEIEKKISKLVNGWE